MEAGNETSITISALGELPRNGRMSSTQSAINSPSLSIDVAGFITSEEECHSRNFICHCTTSGRVQLSDLLLRPSLPGSLIHWQRHAGLNDPWADGVDPDARACELI